MNPIELLLEVVADKKDNPDATITVGDVVRWLERYNAAETSAPTPAAPAPAAPQAPAAPAA